MDSALVLKIKYDNENKLGDDLIDNLLLSSELIASITKESSDKSLYLIWRIIALSEIPYSNRLKYTQDILEDIERKYATWKGFSITGISDGILPCYNAMLIEAYSKLGYYDKTSVKNAVEWIKRYQVFNRIDKSEWSGKGIKKYGGCMKSVPCYIGIVKSVKALIYYSLYSNVEDNEIDQLIKNGMEYILSHRLFQRLSNTEPITKHILDIAYPPSYQLNIIELLDITYMTGNINHPNVQEAIRFVKAKIKKDNNWRINYIYKTDGYVSFDKRGSKGEWVSYLLEKYLKQVE